LSDLEQNFSVDAVFVIQVLNTFLPTSEVPGTIIRLILFDFEQINRHGMGWDSRPRTPDDCATDASGITLCGARGVWVAVVDSMCRMMSGNSCF